MENLKEELLKLRTKKQIVYYQMFKNGQIIPETREFARDLTKIGNENTVGVLEYVLTEALKRYSYKSDFDFVDMRLNAGVVYDAKDIEDGKIRMNARPYDNIACFKVDSITSYLNGEQSNGFEYVAEHGGYSGLMLYNEVVKELRERGFNFEGPETFEDLKNAVLYGQDFNLDITMDLSLDNEQKLVLK